MNDLYNIHDVIRNDVENLLMEVHTSIPARVLEYNSTKQTVNVAVAVNRPTQRGASIPAGEYHDVPVIFPAGGNWVIAGPLEPDDIVQLVVPHYGTEDFMAGERHQTGDAKFVSRHDLNDAVALPGMYTSNSITRKEAHKDKFHIANGDSSVILIGEEDITVQVGNTVFKVDANGVTVTGDLTVSGTVQGAVIQTPTVGLATHTHIHTDTGGTPDPATSATGIG